MVFCLFVCLNFLFFPFLYQSGNWVSVGGKAGPEGRGGPLHLLLLGLNSVGVREKTIAL